jgi:hypothetical protein
MPKKNDNIVGRAEGPPAGGGRQTPEQAEIVKQGEGGRSDSERSAEAAEQSQVPGNPAVGGSSNGHSDQIGSRGAEEDRKVAGGLAQTEQDHLEAERRRRG